MSVAEELLGASAQGDEEEEAESEKADGKGVLQVADGKGVLQVVAVHTWPTFADMLTILLVIMLTILLVIILTLPSELAHTLR